MKQRVFLRKIKRKWCVLVGEILVYEGDATGAKNVHEVVSSAIGDVVNDIVNEVARKATAEERKRAALLCLCRHASMATDDSAANEASKCARAILSPKWRKMRSADLMKLLRKSGVKLPGRPVDAQDAVLQERERAASVVDTISQLSTAGKSGPFRDIMREVLDICSRSIRNEVLAQATPEQLRLHLQDRARETLSVKRSCVVCKRESKAPGGKLPAGWIANAEGVCWCSKCKPVPAGG